MGQEKTPASGPHRFALADPRPMMQDRALLASLAQEIQAPLGVIETSLALLADFPIKPDQALTLQRIAQASAHLRRHAQDFLAALRFGEDAFAIEQRAFSLRPLIERLLALHGARAKAKGLTLRLDCQVDQGLQLSGDPLRLSQILDILLSNAIRHTETGKVVLRVLRPSDDASCLRFEVEDTGPGLPEDKQAEILEPFAQLSPPDGPKGVGHGIGLAICVRLARKLGGRFGLRSALGCGSLFWLHLPLPEGARDPVERTARPRASVMGARVLLVEDDLPFADLMQCIADRWGFRMTLSSSPEEARRHLAQTRHDLVILDRHLGHSQSGHALLADLDRLTPSDPPGVLVLTGDPHDNVAFSRFPRLTIRSLPKFAPLVDLRAAMESLVVRTAGKG